MSFTDIFIRRPVLATVVSLLILLVGLASLFNLSVRQYPEITNTTLTITTAYPGANAELIRGFITTPIMSAVASAEGIDTLTSSSQQNVSTVTLNLRLDANADRAVSDVLSKVQQVKNVLPREAQDSDRHAADGRHDRADVHVVQQQGDDGLADHRLSDARGAAASADHRRCRQRADPGRADVRHAHLAQSRQDGRARHHAARRAHGADGEQLRHRRRAR